MSNSYKSQILQSLEAQASAALSVFHSNLKVVNDSWAAPNSIKGIESFINF